MYNQSDDRKEKVSGQEICGEGYSSSYGSSSGNGDMAREAIALVERIGNHKVEYGTPRDAGNGFSSWCYVCCTFVSEVVYNVTGHKYNFANYNTVDVQGEQFYRHSDDFELIYYHPGVTGTSPDFSGPVNTDKQLSDLLQPGDIVATYSNSATFQHIMIYIGDGKYANMADTPNAVCIQERGFGINCKYVFRLKGYNSQSVSNLDNFLFIGDSRTVLMQQELRSLGNNIEIRAASSSTPSDWKTTCRTGDPIVIKGTPISRFPSSVSGISVALGVNEAKTGVSSMKTLLENLQVKYPNVPIFVNSVIYVGSNYSYGSYRANEFNNDIDNFNNQIKNFCKSKSNMTYIDVSNGLYSGRALSSSYTTDNVHFNSAGNNKLKENIRNAIANGGTASSGQGNSGSATVSNGPATGTGTASIQNTDVNADGYESIFTSGTTGRQFKEYRQNIPNWEAKYPIQHLASTNRGWPGECGTVSTIILGSGYSANATFADITRKMESTGGGTLIDSWTKEYTGQDISWEHSYSQSDIANKLSNGYVGILHSTSSLVSSSGTHYMVLLDISSDKSKVYLSNPWMGSNYQGWITFDMLYNIFESVGWVTNDGSAVSYSGESTSGGDISCTGTESGKYYTQLKKTDGLNRIDFMNSNPEIIHRYIREGGEYLKYVGYARSKLNLSYWNLKNLFQKVYEKHGGSLPWAYGKTLGFENIYNSSGGNLRSSSGGRFIWPVPEYVEAGLSMWEQITSTFGNRVHPISHQPGNMHNGIDISSHSVNANAKIVAAASGEVILVVDNIPGKTEYSSYGNHVIIKHSDGYYTLYGHMALGTIKVKVGDKVNSGQEIGTMGTTGSSTGNHLHFEIAKIDGDISPSEYYSSTRLDPCDFFNDDCSPIGGGLSGPSGLDLSVEEIKDFARMIYGEAGSNTYELQVACAAAAINQYKDHKEKGRDIDFFEDLIHDYWNFNGYNSSFVISESDSVYKAAVAALSGEDPTGGALYFYAPAAMSPPGPSAWHESLTYLCTIDGVRFFKP